jgi:hypothetical protein
MPTYEPPLSFLHVGGEVSPNPAAFAVDDALLLKLTDSRLAALDRGCMMRIFGGLLILGPRSRYRLHVFILARMAIPRARSLSLAVLTAAAHDGP